MAAGISGLPPTLKVIQPFLKVAKEYEKRDPIVAYFCRLHAVQKGIQTDSKSKEGKSFLFQLMDQLETAKKGLSQEEALTDNTLGKTYMDEKATQLFLWADTEDRAARFNKNVIKSFYTSSLLYDTLVEFGELSPEASQRQKYSKWKATYINKCLKEGTTPIPGPPEGENEEFGDEFGEASSSFNIQPVPPDSSSVAGGKLPYPTDPYNTGQPSPYSQIPSQPPSYHQPTAPHNPPSTAAHVPEPQPGPSSTSSLTVADFDKAQKLCRYAQSAMQYEDVDTAIDNLEKALAIMKAGRQ